MAFFTYPPNEAISPLFTQISVSSITTGTNVFGSETVASSITSFSYIKPADVGTLDGRTVGIRARVTGNTNQTTGATIALRAEARRSTMSASVSDTASFTALSLGKGALIDFTAASIPATYTSTGTHRAILIDQVFGSNLTGNTLAISNIFGIEFVADSQANTGRKANIKMNALSGGTVGNAQIADNDAYSGSWFINSTSTAQSQLSGIVGLGASPNAAFGLRVGHTALTGTGQVGISIDAVASTAATSSMSGITSGPSTANSAFTCGLFMAFNASNTAKGAASTITRHVMYYGATPTQGTNNAFIADNTSFTGSWFINSTTTNKSSFTGAIATVRFDVASAATITALDSTRNFVKLTGSTATALQGITAGIDGQRLTLVNLTGANLTVAHENAGATAANRITTMTGADIATTANGAAEFIYDTSSSRWICLYVTA